MPVSDRTGSDLWVALKLFCCTKCWGYIGIHGDMCAVVCSGSLKAGSEVNYSCPVRVRDNRSQTTMIIWKSARTDDDEYRRNENNAN